MFEPIYETATKHYEFFYGKEKNEYLVVGIDKSTRYMAAFCVQLTSKAAFDDYVSRILVDEMDALTFRD